MVQIKIPNFKQPLLWEKIIIDWQKLQEATQNNNYINCSLLLDSWQLAIQAREAWYILNIWQIPLNRIKKYFWCQEAMAFLEWANNYKLICEQFNYYNYLQDHVSDSTSEDIPNNIKIFKDYSNKHIAAGLETSNKPDCFSIACRDFIQEINSAARWASNPELTGNIGVVVLDLDNTYSQVDYIFSNFLPETEYNIAVSAKLDTYPLINIAILILQIANCYITKDQIKYEDFSRLLRTKFIGGANLELSGRSYFDYILREKVDYKFNWQYIKNFLLKISQQHQVHSVKFFIKFLDDFEWAINARNLIDNNKYNCNYWVSFCKEILQTFNWGKENINDAEQHQINCWQDFLEKYNELSNFIGEHDLKECIKILVKLSKLYNVEPKKIISKNISNVTNVTKNITIVNLLEAINMKFDHLWVSGLSSNNWPNEYQFNPFLPIALQKEFCIPHLNDMQNLEIHNKFFKQLIAVTDKLFICSYPLYVDNNLARCSRLINNFQKFTIDMQLKINQKIKLKINPETYTDDIAPTYKGNTFSGTKFLKLQSACPFQANAKVRLRALGLQRPLSYLSKAIKGEILHKTLAQFWLQYKSSDALQKLSINIIQKELLAIVNKNLNNLKKTRPISLNPSIFQIEARRIADLCFDFIKKYDLEREKFTTIHLEEKFTVKLREFLINIKIDRIDQLSNGDLLVIDYKTGKGSINSWNSMRMDDPQLPIYSLCSSNIKGLILAVIRVDKLELLGVLGNLDLDNMVLPDAKLIHLTNWDEHLAKWYEDLYRLATEFKNGVAILDPKYGARTCKACDLKYMCRVFAKD